MEKGELRIGNYVQDWMNPKNGVVERQIELGDFVAISNYGNHPYPIKPIPLTEEWLVNFGFSDKEYKPGYIGVDFKANLIIDFVLTNPKTMGEWQEYYVWEHVKNMYTKLEYVHQLQNLFHAVTGQELILTTN